MMARRRRSVTVVGGWRSHVEWLTVAMKREGPCGRFAIVDRRELHLADGAGCRVKADVEHTV